MHRLVRQGFFGSAKKQHLSFHSFNSSIDHLCNRLKNSRIFIMAKQVSEIGNEPGCNREYTN